MRFGKLPTEDENALALTRSSISSMEALFEDELALMEKCSILVKACVIGLNNHAKQFINKVVRK